MHPVGRHPGATWRKADLQIHTPRDPNWSGSPALPGGSAAEEKARKDWAEGFVVECLKRGLQAIAITDHHDFCFVTYVREAIDVNPDAIGKLWLFPGVEVTCNDAVQCLVLFDSATTPPVWHRLFGGHLQGIAATSDLEARCAQANACGKDTKDFLEGMARDSELSKHSIAFPHASNEGAHKSMLRVGFHSRFRESPFDGVYTEKAFDKLDENTKKKIQGKITEWGPRRRGIITTGDNRHASFDRLAKHECWIRLGEPTAEALRQAVLADEARIAYATPTLPPQRIELLEVSSSITGTNFQLSFNDGFNALIGGRGSGKTAILEFLRFGLARSARDIRSDASEAHSREYELISSTLPGGSVRITLIRDGVREVWSRTLDKSDVIMVTLPDGTTETLSIPAAQQRFRARGFYQKQLSTLVADRDRAAEQITGIASAESLDKRQQADQRVAAAKREVTTAVQNVVEFWIASSNNEQDRLAVADVKRRIDAIRKQLEESGLSPESQAILDAAPVYATLGSLASEAGDAITRDFAALDLVRASRPSINPSAFEKGLGFEEVSTFVAEIGKRRAEIRKSLEGATTALTGLQAAWQTFHNAFQKRKSEFDAKHAAAIAQQTNLSSLVNELQKLADALQRAEAAERKSGDALKAMEGAQAALAAARKSLAEARSERRTLLMEVAGQVQTMSDGVLVAEVRSETRPRQMVDALMTLTEGGRIRDAQMRFEDLVAEAMATGGWPTRIDNLADVYRHKVQTQAVSSEISEALNAQLTQALGSLTGSQATTIYSRLDTNHLAALMSAVPDDFVVFQYQDAKGLIPFEQASPGQQAAALLHLLLHQEAGTLIVDQPEDDLDNKTIMKIVRLLQTTKQKRQLIFATHNPNFVVNGDADKVVALTSAVDAEQVEGPRVAVDVDGAIETPRVRLAITDLMEGGKEAFELRSRKYQFTQ